MRMFGCIAYVMVPNEKEVSSMPKAPNIGFLVIAKTLNHIDSCVGNQQNYKSKDFVFMKDNTSIGINLEMQPS